MKRELMAGIVAGILCVCGMAVGAEAPKLELGEAAPAIKLQKNPGTAVTRGIRTVLRRLLGSESRHYEKRSPSFVRARFRCRTPKIGCDAITSSAFPQHSSTSEWKSWL